MITKRLSSRTPTVLFSTLRLGGVPTRTTTVTLNSECLAWYRGCRTLALTTSTLKHGLIRRRIRGLHI